MFTHTCFFSSGGLSGVAVLAESHISVHTWPEMSYAAFDVFMCGNARPELSVELIKSKLTASKVDVSCIKRGVVKSEVLLSLYIMVMVKS